MKLAIVTDAWRPQINGVVTTLVKTAETLEGRGWEVCMVTPEGARSIPCPTYREIRLTIGAGRHVKQLLGDFQPDAVHLVTEGPLGLSGRAWCRQHKWHFTTSFHTQFPEYINLRAKVPLSWTYGGMKWFHGGAERTMVNTKRVKENLEARGFRNLVYWSRGVDTELFRPGDKAFLDLPRPIMAYVGRIAVEKNLEAFLKLDLPGTKYLIGGGPDFDMLKAKYPNAHFAGPIVPPELAAHVAAADVFVFPSRTDTFGIVMIEAMACGVPVAAYPVQGPVDVVKDGVTGILSEDLSQAVHDAQALDPQACREYACEYSWDRCTDQFAGNLTSVHRGGHLLPRDGEDSDGA